MTEPNTVQILPAEYVGSAQIVDNAITVGGFKVPLGRATKAESVGVYVRRMSTDLSVIEVSLAFHDGLAQEELDQQNAEASRYPLGDKEYWRAAMVGKYQTGLAGRLMTEEDFEEYWSDGEE